MSTQKKRALRGTAVFRTKILHVNVYGLDSRWHPTTYRQLPRKFAPKDLCRQAIIQQQLPACSNCWKPILWDPLVRDWNIALNWGAHIRLKASATSSNREADLESHLPASFFSYLTPGSDARPTEAIRLRTSDDPARSAEQPRPVAPLMAASSVQRWEATNK